MYNNTILSKLSTWCYYNIRLRLKRFLYNHLIRYKILVLIIETKKNSTKTYFGYFSFIENDVVNTTFHFDMISKNFLTKWGAYRKVKEIEKFKKIDNKKIDNKTTFTDIYVVAF